MNELEKSLIEAWPDVKLNDVKEVHFDDERYLKYLCNIDYTNYRGERSYRQIHPVAVSYVSTEWHPEVQFILTAVDTKKGAIRDFAVRDIHDFTIIPTDIYISNKTGVFIRKGDEIHLVDSHELLPPYEEPTDAEYEKMMAEESFLNSP